MKNKILTIINIIITMRRKKIYNKSNIIFSNRWYKYVEYGIEYYLSARVACLADFYNVSGNLYHHAFEMLLKGKLIKNGAKAQDLKKGNHGLMGIWKKFKKTGKPTLDNFDSVIKDLNKFEKNRYPTFYDGKGIITLIGFGVKSGSISEKNRNKADVYALDGDKMDELFKVIIEEIPDIFKVSFIGFKRDRRINMYYEQNKYKIIL